MTSAPFDLSIDSGGDEFPVAGDAPRLSWKIPVAAGSPRGYELQASVDGVDLPAVATDSTRHLHVAWPWRALRSGESVAWRVRAIADEGASDWSDRHRFEVGLLAPDWSAQWISPVEHDDPGYGKRGAHTLAVDVDLPDGVASARLYATALGVYEAFVNDERAGSAELSPGSTSYDRTLYAQASDVTSSLRAGANRIEIVLSDGWYRGQVGAFRMPSGWGTTLGVRAELHVRLTDGTTRVVRTDDAWTSRESLIVRADLMDGQTTDLTRALPAPAPAIVGAVTGPDISWSPAPPVKIIETLPVVSATQHADGHWLVDFGQNASGWVVLDDLGPEGARTVIDYGEYAGPDRELDSTHLDSSRPGEPAITFVQRDEVVSRGNAQDSFEPRHTVHGFQYIRVARDRGAFDPASVKMRVVHTDLRRTGGFVCSDPDITRLHEIADWSFRGNAVDVPTDCPTRERLAWSGDYQVFAPTAVRLYDVLGFTRKWLQSVRDDQLDDGRIANFSPDGRRIKHNLDDQFAMMTGSAGWADAITLVPWELYTAYGDTRVLAENWDAMRRWVEWALQSARTSRHHSRSQRSSEAEPHEAYLWDGAFHWGEWTEPQPKGPNGERVDLVHDNPMQWFMADKGEVGTAYLYRSTSIAAEVAGILGHDDEARQYAETAAQIRAAWQHEFLRPDGTTQDDTQASYVRALSFGLIPDDSRAVTARRLVDLVRAADTHLSTGFLSTGDLLPVLTETGHADVAYELLLQRSEPSWLTMVDRGATTIWESWDGIDEEGRAHDSLNHYSKGAVIRFLHTHTLGLRQQADSRAWESIVIAPVPGGGMTWAKGWHESPQGRIGVEWRLIGDEIEITAEVPAGTQARVVFPDGHAESVAPGTFVGRRAIAR